VIKLELNLREAEGDGLVQPRAEMALRGNLTAALSACGEVFK